MFDRNVLYNTGHYENLSCDKVSSFKADTRVCVYLEGSDKHREYS